MRPSRRFLKGILILAFWLGVWALLARLVDRELLLPGPWRVLERLFVLMRTADFWRITAVSLGRILLGAVIGVGAGILLAMGTARFSLLEAALSPLLTLVQSTPVTSFILLALVWVGRAAVPCVIVVLMVLPVIWSGVSAGIKATDGQLLELAKVYGLSPWRKVRRIYTPAAEPYFLSAARSCIGLAWKSGVAAEVLTVPARSIGRMLYESKLYLETVDLFAWTVVVILCSLAIEKLLTAAIGRFQRRKGGSHDTL